MSLIAIQKMAESLKKAKHVVVLTGAGISTESGIPDFRSSEGVWTYDRKREELMHINYFNGSPKKFWEAYKDIFKIKLAGDFKPNYGHEFLVELERLGKKVTILTQNVDGLHQEAGSSRVLELHGSIKKAICPACTKRKENNKALAHLPSEYPFSYVQEHDLPRCTQCNMILKPDVVLFGENIRHYTDAFSIPLLADVVLVLGSSLQVTPVSLIPNAYKHDLYKDNPNGQLFLINRDPTDWDYLFDAIVHDGIGKTLKSIRNLMEE